MISTFGKLKLLIWKNYIRQKRHPFKLLLEILVPVLQCLLLLFLRFKITSEKVPGALYTRLV